MTTLTTSAAVIALTFAVSVPLAAQNGAETAYDRMARAWSSVQTLEATFDQKITNPLLGRSVTSKGVFLQERPGKVSITFTQPAGDRIVGDGKTLWVYLPSSAPGQVLKLPGDADGAIVADLLGQLLETPKRAFIISGGDAVTIDGRATRRVQLLPRSPDAVPFQKATLWLDEQNPRPVRVQVIDGQGVDRTITLTSWTPGATLPRDAFRFAVPKGVKVTTKLPM
ncbi:outer membrane lipoprotein carrier protein LolA [Gemmatimonas sp.]|jgi:outer membrane lipoprotein carrier protein|uniref:outer membrane lipoprotein carrier protein LolA n=1 Tax=Gemmatimonas sp. TaxID=1962908 RepID=UPI0037BE8B1E